MISVIISVIIIDSNIIILIITTMCIKISLRHLSLATLVDLQLPLVVSTPQVSSIQSSSYFLIITIVIIIILVVIVVSVIRIMIAVLC